MVLNNLGNVFHDQGRFTDAESMYRQALAIDAAAFGPYSTVVVQDTRTLGLLYKDRGDAARARQFLSRADSLVRKRHQVTGAGIQQQGLGNAAHGGTNPCEGRL